MSKLATADYELWNELVEAYAINFICEFDLPEALVYCCQQMATGKPYCFPLPLLATDLDHADWLLQPFWGIY
jgi:hypothetical protein